MKLIILIRKYQKTVANSCGSGPPVTEPLADFALHQLLTIARRGEQCEGYEACKAVKALTAFTEMREAFNKNLHSLGISPFMSVTNCEELFPQCFFM